MADRDVFNVIAGEAKYGAGSFDDMLGVASAIYNRSQSLGVSPGNVVRNRNEFNAYGKALPAGASTKRARDAWNQVVTQGPVHPGTFYATPKAVGNLPKGLSQVHETLGHRYFTDPQNRSINTALGYRQPQAITGAQRAITSQMSPQPSRVPTPTFPQRAAPTLSSSLAANPVSPSSIRSASAVPAGLTSMATRGGRLGPSTTTGVPTPTARPSYTAPQTQVATRAPDASRFGGHMPMQAPRSYLDRYAETRPGLTGSRVAPQSVTAGLEPTPAQEANLQDRLGTFTPTVDVASLRTRNVPTPTARPMSIGSVLGVSAASAATPPQAAPGSLRAPVSSAMLSASLTPGAVGSFAPRTPVTPSDRLASRPPMSVPTPTFASRVPTPTSAPRTAVAASYVTGRVPTPTARPASVPTPTSRPSVAAPARAAVRTAPTAQRTAAAPARQAQTVAQDPWGGLRTPAASSQPQGARSTVGPFGMSRNTIGRVAGTALGTEVAGPLGGLLGGFIGGRIGNSSSNAAQGRGGPAGSNGGRASSGRSSTGSAFSGGNGGFSERDSAVGRDGGKVGGGSSRSSAANAGRSSSSGGRSGSSSGGKSGGGGKGGRK